MFLLFGVFIFGCGTTHAMEVWTLWHGTYRLAGVVKAVTAAASVLTAVLLVRLMPDALALPSPAQLREVNEGLAREIEERRKVDAALHQANEELERRVRQRTAELAAANDELRLEMDRRQHADEERRSHSNRPSSRCRRSWRTSCGSRRWASWRRRSPTRSISR